jgi:hypothetical protein
MPRTNHDYRGNKKDRGTSQDQRNKNMTTEGIINYAMEQIMTMKKEQKNQHPWNKPLL